MVLKYFVLSFLLLSQGHAAQQDRPEAIISCFKRCMEHKEEELKRLKKNRDDLKQKYEKLINLCDPNGVKTSIINNSCQPATLSDKVLSRHVQEMKELQEERPVAYLLSLLVQKERELEQLKRDIDNLEMQYSEMIYYTLVLGS